MQETTGRLCAQQAAEVAGQNRTSIKLRGKPLELKRAKNLANVDTNAKVSFGGGIKRHARFLSPLTSNLRISLAPIRCCTHTRSLSIVV